MCLFAIKYFLWWRSICSNILSTLYCLVSCYWVFRVCYIVWIQVLYETHVLQIFFPYYSFFFHSLNSIFWRTKVFRNPVYEFLPWWIILMVLCLRFFWLTKDKNIFCYIFFQKFYSFRFYSFSLGLWLILIFIYGAWCVWKYFWFFFFCIYVSNCSNAICCKVNKNLIY